MKADIIIFTVADYDGLGKRVIEISVRPYPQIIWIDGERFPPKKAKGHHLGNGAP